MEIQLFHSVRANGRSHFTEALKDDEPGQLRLDPTDHEARLHRSGFSEDSMHEIDLELINI